MALNYIQRLTLFLYSEYLLPNFFSRFSSSIGMNNFSIITMKIIGKTNEDNEPRKTAVPSKIDNIPIYIGCLLILNGPVTIKKDGIK